MATKTATQATNSTSLSCPSAQHRIVLPTAPTEPNCDFSRERLFVYGDPGIGKTTFALQFPKTLLLACEQGARALRRSEIVITCWPDFVAAIDLICAGNHAFETVCIDTIDAAYKFCDDYVKREKCGGIAYLGDADKGRGWSLLQIELITQLRRLFATPLGIIITSHSVRREVKSRTGAKSERIVSSLSEGVRRLIEAEVSIVAYLDSARVKTKSGDIVERRFLFPQPSAHFDAKDRSGCLYKSRIPLSYEAVHEVYREGWARKQAAVDPNVATEVETVPEEPEVIAESEVNESGDPVVAAETTENKS